MPNTSIISLFTGILSYKMLDFLQKNKDFFDHCEKCAKEKAGTFPFNIPNPEKV